MFASLHSSFLIFVSFTYVLFPIFILSSLPFFFFPFLFMYLFNSILHYPSIFWIVHKSQGTVSSLPSPMIGFVGRIRSETLLYCSGFQSPVSSLLHSLESPFLTHWGPLATLSCLFTLAAASSQATFSPSGHQSDCNPTSH